MASRTLWRSKAATSGTAPCILNSTSGPGLRSGGAKKVADSTCNAGFGAVLAHRRDGIVRGSATLVALSDEAQIDSIRTPRGGVAQLFEGVVRPVLPQLAHGQHRPESQTLCDAEWYGQFEAPEDRTHVPRGVQ